jgi:hypothetical protein
MRILPFLLLAAAVACTSSDPTEVATPVPNPATQSTITLRNETSEPLVFLAAGEGTLALLTIPTTLPPGSYEDKLVTPGGSASVTDIIGYDPELGVNFFIWRVDRSSGIAHLGRHRLVTAAELEAADGLVRIKTFAP